MALYEVELVEIGPQYNLLHISEHSGDILGICSTRVMTEDMRAIICNRGE